MPTNALIDEKSPYLRQHAHNPVNWLPWGEAAFSKARTEDKPIFLSIGYSTCHWCHVMAHESFENDDVAAQLNRDFVPVKLDREERPDVDRIYMLFVQASTGSGGWPMSVFLTPDLKPFFGGTYFPPDSRYGRPGFRELLTYLARAWQQERGQVELSGSQVTEQLRGLAATPQTGREPDRALFDSAYQLFRRMFDSVWGGFGGAPKFPRPVVLNYLLRFCAASQSEEALAMVSKTLTGMARGGMHDQLGGGFHRYSVDERWFVPHFEKMLYDQAQLAVAYLEAFQAEARPEFAAVARDIFAYVARDLGDAQGGFYSAEDADSPDPENPLHGREGAFYVWRQSEVAEILGEEAGRLFSQRYGVLPDGNVEQDPHAEFSGRNILYQALKLDELALRAELPADNVSGALTASAQKLFARRETRPRPHLDDKILTAWNGLQISALAKGYAVLGDVEYRQEAERAADFLLHAMYDPASGRLWRSFSEGHAGVAGFLDDYAFFAQALTDLFEVTFEARYLTAAASVAQAAAVRFEDREYGGFFSTTADAADLLLRMKDDYDGAEPSGNSVFTDVLLRLAHLTGNPEWEETAARSLRAATPRLEKQPSAAPQMLVALGRWLAGAQHLVIRCQVIDEQVLGLAREQWKKFEPNLVTLVVSDDSAHRSELASFFRDLDNTGRITVYRCTNFTCELPEVVA